MNLRDLRYLVALADHKHFGRAAAASFVSQPTLSTQLKKFEDELGMALVERNPRNVLLTEVGEAVVARAKVILREADEIKAIARRAKDPESGMVRLGIFPTLAPYLLPHVVPNIVKRFPKLELILVEEKTEVILKKLHDGELDAGVLALPIHDDSLHAEFLFEEAFVLALPKHHRLAKARRVKLADLATESLLLLDDGHCLRDQALEVCRKAGTEAQDFGATSLETLRQMVAAGLGLTLLPRLATEGPFGAARGLAVRPFAPPSPYRVIGAAWRRSTTRGEAIAAVCDVISRTAL